MLLALALCGCAKDNIEAGTAPLAVDLSALNPCKTVLQKAPLPIVTKATDARLAFMKDDAALLTAREQIDTGRNCIADVQNRYAAPK